MMNCAGYKISEKNLSDLDEVTHQHLPIYNKVCIRVEQSELTKKLIVIELNRFLSQRA